MIRTHPLLETGSDQMGLSLVDKKDTDCRCTLTTRPKPSAAGPVWRGGARERYEKPGAPFRERPVLSGADFAPCLVPVVGLEPAHKSYKMPEI